MATFARLRACRPVIQAKARREADKEVQKNTHELGCMKDENTRLLAQVSQVRFRRHKY